MIIFDSVCITPQFVWVEDRKYVQKDGILYMVRNREEDPDYTADEKWDLKNWKGKRCRRTRDQHLFTESVQEMNRILHMCDSSHKQLDTDISLSKNSFVENDCTKSHPNKKQNLLLSYLLYGGTLMKNSLLLRLLFNV